MAIKIPALRGHRLVIKTKFTGVTLYLKHVCHSLVDSVTKYTIQLLLLLSPLG